MNLPTIVDAEQGQIISTLIRNHLKKIGAVEEWRMHTSHAFMHAVNILHHRSDTEHIVINPKVEGRIRMVGAENHSH